MLTVLTPKNLSTVKTLVIAGEAINYNELDRWLKSGIRIINAYGPTEATVCATMQECRSDIPATVIGRPINNSELYILDGDFKLVPVGVEGELFISGVNLSQGYLHHDDETAKLFLTIDIEGIGKKLLYKTGDLASYLPTGEVEYRGRIDQQVKIHGFRISLIEVTQFIQKNPNVKSAAVMAEQNDTEACLIAYVVLSDHAHNINSSSLKRWLADFLPHYSIPTEWYFLDTLPLTLNGKIDKDALYEFRIKNLKNNKCETIVNKNDLTETQKTIIDVWSELLNVNPEKFPITHSFFELGGDSIVGIQAISQLQRRGLDIELEMIFDYPTVQELSEKIDNSDFENKQTVNTRNVVNQPEIKMEKTEFSPLTPIQSWFFELQDSSLNHYNQVMFLKISEQVHLDLLNKTCNIICRKYDAFSLRFKKDQYNVWKQHQTALEENKIEYIVKHKLFSQSEQGKLTELKNICAALQQCLDIGKGPLFCGVLIEDKKDEWRRLFLVAHHLIIDSVSWRIFLANFEITYRNLKAGKVGTLNHNSISYLNWSQFLNSSSGFKAVENELPYWQEIESLETMAIPMNNSILSNRYDNFSTIQTSLLSEKTASLLRKIPAAYQTEINEILLTALVYTIGEWQNNYVLKIDLEGHGRESIADYIPCPTKSIFST